MKILFLMVNILLLSSCFNTDEPKPNPEEPLGLLWEYEYEMKGWGAWGQPVLVGDSLLLMTGDEYISCIKIDSGKVKWQYQTPNGSAASMRNILYDDNQVYGWQYNSNNEVYAIDINTGEENWSIDSVGSYRYHGLSPEFYYAPYSRKFYKISKTGIVVDSVIAERTFWTISYWNNRILSSQSWSGGIYDRGRIICYDEESLIELWRYDSPGGTFAMCYPVFEDGIMYVGTVWGSNNKVIALNAETGDVIWENDSDDISAIKVLLTGDILYVEAGAAIYALNKATGFQLWRTNLPNPDESPSLSYWDGYIYVENFGTLFVLNAENGEIVHKGSGPDNASVEQVSAGAGKIFVQSTQHLYAFTPYDPEKDND